MNTKQLQIKDYNYLLPEERIAKYPLDERDSSKLLLRSTSGELREDHFYNLPNYVKKGALMVFNNTKVIQARLHFHKSTGALVEIFCLEPYVPREYQQSFSTTGSVTWICLIGNLKKWKEGCLERKLCIRGETVLLMAERLRQIDTGHEVCFSWDNPTVTWSEVLESVGELPIPPYLNRDTEACDLNSYQTVYSKVKGSVAAPTAGLHFTPGILEELERKGVERAEVTLHVGAGTFKPVKSEYIEGHIMHAEWIAVARETIEQLLAHGAQCVAVGTTSVRTVESLYYIGVRLHQMKHAGQTATDDDLHVSQWFPYEYAASSENPLTPIEALKEVLLFLDEHRQSVLHTTTRIIIAPGYHYHIVKTIVTNFHQPQSTLLLLVSAFVSGAWRPIYDYALQNGFRFLSYGDSSILNYDAL